MFILAASEPVLHEVMVLFSFTFCIFVHGFQGWNVTQYVHAGSCLILASSSKQHDFLFYFIICLEFDIDNVNITRAQ